MKARQNGRGLLRKTMQLTILALGVTSVPAMEVLNSKNEVVASIPDKVQGTEVEEDLHPDDVDTYVHEVDDVKVYATDADSALDVNNHQHSSYTDADGEEIEDLSEDKTLDKVDKSEDEELKDLMGQLLSADPFNGGEEPDDYVEEVVDKAGHHMRKEVHQGDGFKSVEISSDTPLTDSDIGGIISNMIAQQMAQDMARMQQSMMKQVGGGHQQPIMVIPQNSLPDLSDDDADEEAEEEETAQEVIDRVKKATEKQQQGMMAGMRIKTEEIPADHAMQPSFAPSSDAQKRASSNSDSTSQNESEPAPAAAAGQTQAQIDDSRKIKQGHKTYVVGLGLVVTAALVYFFSSQANQSQGKPPLNGAKDNDDDDNISMTDFGSKRSDLEGSSRDKKPHQSFSTIGYSLGKRDTSKRD